MREIIRGAQFKRDVKLARKRGKDLEKLRELILLLAEESSCRRVTETTLWRRVATPPRQSYRTRLASAL